MYPAHFAVGLALKSVQPKAPTWGLMLGVGLLDIVFGSCVAVGLEHVTPARLFAPWSHSLLMAFIWAGLYGAAFARWGRDVVTVMVLAVASHWLLDIFVRRPALGLWPNSPIELGFQSTFGGLAGWFEMLVTVVALAIYVAHAATNDEHGRRWPVACLILAVCYAAEFAAARGAG
jgi:membrane-bound metal-dependent hydrolase YbcI (DUF457 family)